MRGQGPATGLRFSFITGKVREIAKTRRPCTAQETSDHSERANALHVYRGGNEGCGCLGMAEGHVRRRVWLAIQRCGKGRP